MDKRSSLDVQAVELSDVTANRITKLVNVYYTARRHYITPSKRIIKKWIGPWRERPKLTLAV